MRKFILAIAFWVAAVLPVWAEGKAIETTIRAQITALQADDFDRAFTYASPTIQQIFRAPEVFGRMVRQGYPMVYRPSAIEFLELASVEGYYWQKVQIRDGQGRYHLMAYQMVQLDGLWRINGVQLLPSRETGV
ncbi:MAG: DUF4864 domain-containing protein [Rhodobacteraceae bacterium]|jgi:hypothetical protein|nr:DUF4864 domain-containing protein [Paracoccaceae bacterium]